jgi:hypothetical protein
MKRLLRLLPALLLPCLVACASNRPEDGRTTPGNQNLLVTADFENFTTARQAVQTLRPGWLRARAAGGFQGQGQVWVYRDNMRFGGTDRLSAINTVEIDSIRYFDGITASQRWGLGHENGVIHVFSRVQ